MIKFYINSRLLSHLLTYKWHYTNFKPWSCDILLEGILQYTMLSVVSKFPTTGTW